MWFTTRYSVSLVMLVHLEECCLHKNANKLITALGMTSADVVVSAVVVAVMYW